MAATINRYVRVRVESLPVNGDPAFLFDFDGNKKTAKSVEDIQSPMLRACLTYLGVTQPLKLTIRSELPHGSGIGSRCACTVGIVHAIQSFLGQKTSKSKIAEAAIQIEQDLMHEGLGCQDQTITAYGGLSLVRFGGRAGRYLNVVPMVLDPALSEALAERLMLVYLGSGSSAKFALGDRTEQRAMKPTELEDLDDLVEEATEILASGGDLDHFGWFLHRAWQLDQSYREELIPPFLQRTYDKARYAGAMGGRALGANGLGFMLLYVRPDERERVSNALGLKDIPFAFETEGTTLAP